MKARCVERAGARLGWLFVAAVVSAGSVSACGDDAFEDTTPVCVPGKASACFCPTGAPGSKVCDESGLEFGACACTPDAGVDAATDDDAAVDAAAVTAASER